MRRPLLYDAASPAVRRAVALLVEDFELRPLAGVPPDAPGVVLIDADGADPGPHGARRVVALVPAGDARPWPAHWYALVPRDAGAAVLRRAVANAVADLEAAAEIQRLAHELGELNAVGIRLSAERDPEALLDLILTKARAITESDAGSLYLVEEGPAGERQLVFALAQNDSLEVPFRSARLPLTSESLAGHVALTGEVVALEDAYAPPPGAPFRLNRAFDQQTGYRTKSMLVVPLRTPQGEILGVLQLINCKPGVRGPLGGRQDIERRVRPFSPRHVSLAGSLASQAAVALANSRLYQSIRRLFDGFVAAAVTAIESRDPTTSGHSFRVAELTVALAEAVNRCDTGRYAAVRFGDDELMELRYAALLHDFGKVGVREHVLMKAKKLYPAELDRIRQRVARIKLGLELRAAHRKLAHLLGGDRDGYAALAASVDAELAAAQAELDGALARIVAANEPASLPADVVAQLQALTRPRFEDHRGVRHSVITPEEAEILAIPQGTLTAAEIQEIRSHVVHTYQFLAQIPWTREFRRIPEIARAHHEKLDGSGYPAGLTGEQIPLQSRMMTIADIYDALSASDRPYKRALPTALALDILTAERRAGRIDGDLLDLFLEAKVYEITRRGTSAPHHVAPAR